MMARSVIRARSGSAGVAADDSVTAAYLLERALDGVRTSATSMSSAGRVAVNYFCRQKISKGVSPPPSVTGLLSSAGSGRRVSAPEPAGA
jgi:hypothetical protein